MRLLYLLFSFSFLLFKSQEAKNYELYPYGQEAYVGGKKQLYKDINEALINHNLKKCEDSTQQYQVGIVVKKDKKILFIKHPDSNYIKKNQCAYDLAKNVLLYLEKWKPAEDNKKKIDAIYVFDFIPSDLFENYEENYVGVSYNRNEPHFPGGVNEFISSFQNNFEAPFSGYKGKVDLKIALEISPEGEMQNIRVESNPYQEDFQKKVIIALKKIKTKWIIPLKYKQLNKPFVFRFSFSFYSE